MAGKELKLAGYSKRAERKSEIAHVAQLAEHILGKDEVTSSNLVMGSRFTARQARIRNGPRQKRID
jgi:hypothetical protein